MNKFLISIGRLQDLFYLGAAYYKTPNMQSLLHQLILAFITEYITLII